MPFYLQLLHPIVLKMCRWNKCHKWLHKLQKVSKKTLCKWQKKTWKKNLQTKQNKNVIWNRFGWCENSVFTTSGVMSIGGFSVGLSCGAWSPGNLPLPKASSFFVSGSAGTASIYVFLQHNFQCSFLLLLTNKNQLLFLQQQEREKKTTKKFTEKCCALKTIKGSGEW